MRKPIIAINNFVTRTGAATVSRSRSRIATNTPQDLDHDQLVIMAEKLEADIAAATCETRRADLIERAATLRTLMDIRARAHTRREAASVALNDSIGRGILVDDD